MGLKYIRGGIRIKSTITPLLFTGLHKVLVHMLSNDKYELHCQIRLIAPWLMTMGHADGRDHDLQARRIREGMGLASPSLCLSSSLRLVTCGYM